jgi:hypothetical protein
MRKDFISQPVLLCHMSEQKDSKYTTAFTISESFSERGCLTEVGTAQ